jgi:hypothetical protein
MASRIERTVACSHGRLPGTTETNALFQCDGCREAKAVEVTTNGDGAAGLFA